MKVHDKAGTTRQATDGTLSGRLRPSFGGCWILYSTQLKTLCLAKLVSQLALVSCIAWSTTHQVV